jgi:hypothetical protein
MSDEPPPAKTAAELRAMAQHARDLASRQLPGDEITRRLHELAAELEAEADTLERRQSP